MKVDFRGWTRPLVLVLSLSCLTAQSAHAAEEREDGKKPSTKSESSRGEVSDILESIGYPELQVVPRASERLALEAKGEESSAIFTHWPIEFSGLATLLVGFTSKSAQRTDLTPKEKRDANAIATATTTVGAAWVVGGIVMGAQRPYRRGAQSISRYTGKDDRSSLLRERLAEEALERPARIMRVLQSTAVITNFGANALAAIHVNDSGKIAAGVGALLAFLPLMFEDHNIEVYEKHIEYKKKIYAPLKTSSLRFESHQSGPSLHYSAANQSLTPITNLVWTF